MAEKIKIEMCMGSSCFAKGNNLLLETLEDQIAARGWQERVALSGLRCEERCKDGPNIRVDGELFTGVDEGALLDLLETRLGDKSVSVRMSSVRRQADRKR